MFKRKTTKDKINTLKQKIAGLKERIAVRVDFSGYWTITGRESYMNDRVKLAELKECLRQLEIQHIKEMNQ